MALKFIWSHGDIWCLICIDLSSLFSFLYQYLNHNSSKAVSFPYTVVIYFTACHFICGVLCVRAWARKYVWKFMCTYYVRVCGDQLLLSLIFSLNLELIDLARLAGKQAACILSCVCLPGCGITYFTALAFDMVLGLPARPCAHIASTLLSYLPRPDSFTYFYRWLDNSFLVPHPLLPLTSF